MLRLRFIHSASAAGALLSFAAPVFAQNTTVASAPVPAQIVTARSAFVSNAGAATYGRDDYYRLTRYDGGPDRLYNTYYHALKAWDRIQLVGAPAEADVVIELRFANPIVDHRNEFELTYDPQVSATLVDPRTRITLWTLTEHVEPARTHDGDNTNFDRAVERLVTDLQLLVTDPNSAAGAAARATLDAPPAGAAASYHRQTRLRNVVIGSALGIFVGGVLSARGGASLPSCDPSQPCTGFAQSALRRTVAFSLSGAVIGALAGLLVPTGP